MPKNSDNRKRAFADVVTIDAWHEAFGDSCPTADLHTDVVFGTGRVGGEPESPVRFRLSIKRAEVVVVIPESEPVDVDPSSVSRDTPELSGHSTEILEQSARGGFQGKGSFSLSPTRISGSASAEASAEASLSASRKLEIVSPISTMIVMQSKTDDGDYRWLLTPQVGPFLSGRPWDATQAPRLKLVDLRRDRSKGIPPSVRLEVRCLREDILIDDLQIKDESFWEAAKTRFGFKNTVAAAISYIRDRLSSEGLDVKNIEDAFGQVTLGSTTAEPIPKSQ